MTFDLKETFPTAFVRTSDTLPVEQSFTVDGSKITIVTFTRFGKYGCRDITCAGIVTEENFQTGRFQRRGYVGNSLARAVIDPIAPIYPGIYDLTLDNVVTSFSFRHGRWEKSHV